MNTLTLGKSMLIAASFLLTTVVGIGLYQTLVIMPSWFRNPPSSFGRIHQYGPSEIRFWIPLQLLTVTALILAVVATWNEQTQRLLVVATLACYVLTAIVTAAYFAPRILAWGKLDPNGAAAPELIVAAAMAGIVLDQAGSSDGCRRVNSNRPRNLKRSIRVDLLRDKIALVTGSSRGIGAAIAQLFAREGAKVAVHGRDRAALSAVKGAIQRAGGNAIEVFGDVTRFEEVEAIRSRIEDALGPIDVLVANAGGSFTRPGLIEETSENGWRASVEGNLTATFLTIKSILPGMKDRKAGIIITMSSAAGRKPHPQAPIPYSAAKAGIQILTQDVTAQAGPYGIRVNCIAPEIILTERNQQHIPEAQQRALSDQHPLRRLGTPDDVASAALFLASENAEWITGIVLDVAGGNVML